MSKNKSIHAAGIFLAACFTCSSLVADQPPIAGADSASTGKNTSTTINVLANDLGDGLTVQMNSSWSLRGGSVALVNNQLVYTPSSNFVGEDKVWYNISDYLGRGNYGEVTINVTEEDVRPKSYPDFVDVIGNETINIDVLANDQGSNLTLNAPSVWSLKGGNVSLVSNRLSYTPKQGFVGEDKIWYSFYDVQGRNANGEVTITATATYLPPVGIPDAITTVSNETVMIDVLANDQGYNLSLQSSSPWSLRGGSVALVNNQLRYTSNASFVGEDKLWYNLVDSRGAVTYSEVTIEVNAPSGINAARISMHNDFLKRQPVVSGEVGGIESTKVTAAAFTGSYQLQVNNGSFLQDNQLITYLATDGQYYTVATSQSYQNTINLKTALPAPIANGGNVWTFYADGSHPNVYGYYALIDFAMTNNYGYTMNWGKHVILGDSWLEATAAETRLAERLPNAQVVNVSRGSQTAADLLERFDTDVRLKNPDFVWLMSGANDAFFGVSVEDYISNMSAIIEKINASGAKAMVFDGMVSGEYFGSDALTLRTHQYADALADLLD
jgi:lysophospholipase L1-like esterase